MRRDLPSGTVTFLFTDVEGSTKLLHELGAEGYADALAEHRARIRDACASHHGVEVDTQGDAFFFAFPTAPGALAAAAELTEALASGPIHVRVGLHTGTPLLADEGYVGGDVHRAARIAAAGHAGQVLVSSSTAALIGPELVDLGEHRFKDLRAPERVFQLGGDQFPAIRSLHRTNLPVPATPFVGRETELAALVELLVWAETKLVTLTGPGGTGKTRLALQAAAESSDAFPDGVYWVPLAALRDPVLVHWAVAQSLDIAETPGAGLVDSLASELDGKRLLILVDNVEHLLPGAATELSQLLARPGPVFLVTSRERLQLRAERVHAVPTLEERDGVALFSERARALDPDFEDDGAVGELCERLDNLPLALELAAARTVVFTPKQLTERLSERLDLLKGGRDTEPRQQTLRAAIEWSYDLLSRGEQQLLGRLSVFRGGCTFAAVEAIAGGDVDTLQSLLDKSLVRRRTGRTGEPRYWMLATIGAFAAERLSESDDVERLRSAHARWYAEQAASIARRVREYEQIAVSSSADELDNVRQGVARAVVTRDPELLGLYLFGIWCAWAMCGNQREALSAAEIWLDLDRDHIDALARFGGLLGAGEILRDSADFARARELKLELMEAARVDPEASFYDWPLGRTVPAALADLVDIDIGEGQLDAALAHAEEALALRIADGALPGIAHAQWALADAYLARGELDLARTTLLESAAAWKEAGRLGDAIGSSLSVASIEIELGSTELARQRVAELLDDVPSLGDLNQVVYAAGTVAAIAACNGDAAAAAVLWSAAQRRAAESSSPVFGGAESAIWRRRGAAIESASSSGELAGMARRGAALGDDELFDAMRAAVRHDEPVELQPDD